MALLHWRKFVFFDQDFVTDTELNQLVSHDEPKDVLQSGQPFITVRISCSSSGRGSIILGDTNGYVYIVNKQLKVNSFRANQKFTSHVKQVAKLPIFLTCGSDQDGINPLIKLWDPEKTDRLNEPTCMRLIRANSGFTRPSAVTCLECNDTLTLMAVGYDDGSIVLFHGDVTKQRRSRFGRPIKISDRPLTGIVFRGETKLQAPLSAYLGQAVSLAETTAFLSTDEGIYYANLSEKSFSKVQLDQLGCQPKCCCLLPGKATSENLFAVGRHNAVYFYQTDGRGPCLAFEGEKLTLYRFKNYLVIVSRDIPSKVDSNMLRNRRNRSIETNIPNYATQSKRVNLIIYDIKHKYIAHSSEVKEIQDIFSEWGQLFIVCTNGKVITFREKDTQTKLEILFNKQQFSLLIEIAKSHQYNEDALTDIFRHYGDYLFSKGDYDGAIVQYNKTIGRSEPSYVIKKFLDSKRVSNLTVYLEALHQKDSASQEHTKLLLNCYSKLRSDQRLKQFIESYEDGNIKFDVEIAVKVLSDAGFYEFAIYLAKKHHKHESLFKLLMENCHDSEAALDYMDGMIDTNEMASYLKTYGRAMLKDAPEKTISMIKAICQRSSEAVSNQGPLTQSTDFTKISRQIYPEEFFHIFIDNNDLFVQLLEQLVDDGTDFITKAVHNLLLELYLNAWRKEKDDLMKNLKAEKIKKLLSHPSEKFDIDQALILCRNSRFDEGLIDLYARAKLYHLVLQYYMDQDDSLKIMKTCENYGNDNPSLYMPALIHYSKSGDERLTQILKSIDHNKVFSPMVVFKILLNSKRVKLGTVKEYLVRFFAKLNDKYIDNENAVDHFKDDTEVIRHKIDEFENHQAVFKPSKCSACQADLDLPTVHFLCTHSYHQNCFHNFSAESDECPICVTANNKLLDEIGSHETSKSNHNKLEKEFSAPCDDVFNSLAKFFGYGLFN